MNNKKLTKSQIQNNQQKGQTNEVGALLKKNRQLINLLLFSFYCSLSKLVLSYQYFIIYSIYKYIIIGMDQKSSTKQTPPKSQNRKLKQKSEVFSDVTHVSQRSYQFQMAPIVKHLNLDIFKVTPCNITKNHNHKHCINYHNPKDRKRYGNMYHTEMCNFIKLDQKCPDGDACLFAHSFVQEHYNYQKYKKQFCSHYPHSISECPYGDFCSYAHSEQEILATLIHNYAEDEDFYMFYYKTEFCPFNLTEHDKSKCVYAHNWQDYRRKTDIYSYEPIPCFNWKTKEYIYEYNTGCELGSNCNMCHGWKEQQYHPNFYKTIKCQVQGCKKGSCPNYHSQKERRSIDNQVISRAFKYVPKNRIIEGVFKTNSHKEGFKPKPEYKSRTMVVAKILNEDSDLKSKTLISIKDRKRESAEKGQWIKQKQIIDSEEESDQNENEIVASQVGKLNLDQ